MLVLVAEHHLVQHPVAHAAIVDHLERAGADFAQVLARLGGAEQLDVPAHRPGGLERVVGRGEILMQ